MFIAGVKDTKRAMAMKTQRNPIIAAGANLPGRPSKTSVWGRAILAPFGMRKHEVVLRARNRGHGHRWSRRLLRSVTKPSFRCVGAPASDEGHIEAPPFPRYRR